MFEFLEKLRSKPEATKKRIAFFGALIFSGCILTIWLSVVLPQIKNFKIVEEPKTETPSPLSALGDNIYDGFSSIKEAFGGVKNSIDSFTTEIEQYQNYASSTENSVENDGSATTTTN